MNIKQAKHRELKENPVERKRYAGIWSQGAQRHFDKLKKKKIRMTGIQKVWWKLRAEESKSQRWQRKARAKNYKPYK